MSDSKEKKDRRRRLRSERRARAAITRGVDHGRALAAMAELAASAFDRAVRVVEDWPVALGRVAAARRYVAARMRGRAAPDVSAEDVLFTAGLLVRIFEADLDLSMSEMVGVLDELGLPTEVVPLVPRPQPGSRVKPNLIAFTIRERPSEAPVPSEASACPGCLACQRFRNAA